MRKPLIEPTRDEWPDDPKYDEVYEQQLAAFDQAVDNIIERRREEGWYGR